MAPVLWPGRWMCPLPLELPAPPDRFYGGRSRACSVSDLSVSAALHRPYCGEYRQSHTPLLSLLPLSPLLRLLHHYLQNYERLQSDYVKDDHDREFSVTDLSVQMFTVPSLVSTCKERWPAVRKRACQFGFLVSFLHFLFLFTLFIPFPFSHFIFHLSFFSSGALKSLRHRN